VNTLTFLKNEKNKKIAGSKYTKKMITNLFDTCIDVLSDYRHTYCSFPPVPPPTGNLQVLTTKKQLHIFMNTAKCTR
jgi:hypothetical protein